MMNSVRLFADTGVLFADAAGWELFLQYVVQGLSVGSLYALIALGYTMVYGIIELINFAHGDLFMLGCFLTLTLLSVLGLGTAGPWGIGIGILAMLVLVPLFCAGVNVAVDRFVYRPLRGAPKLAPLVSAIGVSFVFMNLGMVWPLAERRENAEQPFSDKVVFSVGNVGFFPSREIKHDVLDLIGDMRKPATASEAKPNDMTPAEEITNGGIQIAFRDILVILVTVPIMIALTLFVRFTKLGMAMRATAQNPTAAKLMGIDVDRVISVTFAIGGALAGTASVIYSLYINTVDFQMGFQNGLYAFTAAVLGGIGKIPGAVLGGLVIGLVRSLGGGYISQSWNSALVFVVLIVILVFRPAGILGSQTREKV